MSAFHDPSHRLNGPRQLWKTMSIQNNIPLNVYDDFLVYSVAHNIYLQKKCKFKKILK